MASPLHCNLKYSESFSSSISIIITHWTIVSSSHGSGQLKCGARIEILSLKTLDVHCQRSCYVYTHFDSRAFKEMSLIILSLRSLYSQKELYRLLRNTNMRNKKFNIMLLHKLLFINTNRKLFCCH